MPLISAAARRDVDDRAGVPPVLGAESRVVDFELLHRSDGRLERNLVVRRVVQIDAVHHEVDRVVARAGAVEPEEALPAQRHC